jgi:hypothetical protein
VSDFYLPSDDSAHAGLIIQPEMPHVSGRRDATDRLELSQQIKPGRLSPKKARSTTCKTRRNFWMLDYL